VDTSIAPPLGTFSAGAVTEIPRVANGGKATRR
jgi:hypothetical protein